MSVIPKPHKGFKDVLTVRIFHGHFKAVHFLRGVVKGVYHHPDPVANLDDISHALDRALAVTAFKGKLVTFLYEGEAMDHSFVTTPPMEAKDLRLFLARKAEQEKPFEGKAAFSFTTTASPKGGHIVLLTIAPKAFVDGLTELCRARGLFIQKLIPASAVMGHLMSQMGYARETVIGVVAEVGGRLSLLVGKGDGSLMFDRHFNYDWRQTKEAERIGREIERSLLFAKQQFGQAPEAVIFIGDYTDEFSERMKSLITLPVVIGQHQTYEHYWLTEARQIKRIHPSNLIPASVRSESTRHALTKVVTVLVALFWIGALGSAALVEVILAATVRGAENQGSELARLQEEKERWQGAREELARRKEIVDLIASPPPSRPRLVPRLSGGRGPRRGRAEPGRHRRAGRGMERRPARDHRPPPARGRPHPGRAGEGAGGRPLPADGGGELAERVARRPGQRGRRHTRPALHLRTERGLPVSLDALFDRENIRFWIRRRLPSKVALVVGMAIPALILYVTFTYRAPLIQQAQQQMVVANAVESELIGLKSGWSDEEARRITDDYRATVDSLVGSYDELAGWLADVGETARLSGFRMAYQLSPPLPVEEAPAELTRLPVSVTLESTQQSSGYLTMLALMRHLVESRPGVTMTGAVVHGDPVRGATKLEFTLGLVTTIGAGDTAPEGAV
ncbi:MAG: hypothetical protein HQK87_05130 [Nitrospinae bacterium]|nr:hypothetical protein [Nitrospinota bacterium]